MKTSNKAVLTHCWHAGSMRHISLRHLLDNRAVHAGWVYNIGNLALFAGALMGVSAGGAAALSAPLSALASILFFISGIFYAKRAYPSGNAVSAAGAVLLSVHLVFAGLLFSAALVAILHAVPKALGAVPKKSRALGVKLKIIWLAKPEKLAGYGPMATRLPVAIEAWMAGDWFLLLAALAWLVADWCLTGVSGASGSS